MVERKEKCLESHSFVMLQMVESPVGCYTVEACDKGVHIVSLNDVTDQNFDPVSDFKVNSNCMKKVSSETTKTIEKPLDLAVKWLQSYFYNPTYPTSVLPPVCLSLDKSTEFERKVWTTLATGTGFGVTRTYSELAMQIGHPNASRAVGTALKKNPVCLIIPCHRIIRADGKIGNYSGGTRNKIKEWLLHHENKHDSKEEQA